MTAGVVFVIVVIAGLGVVAHRVKRAFSAAAEFRTIPDQLRIAEIVTGTGRFSKEVFFRQAELGVVTDFARSSSHELVVVGQNGAAFLNDDNSVSKTVPFHRCPTAVVAVTSGSYFLCRGGFWITKVELFDADGKTLWSYDRGLVGINDAAAGNLGPNASTNIVVGFNGDGGVRLLSSEGKEIWKTKDGNVWHVEIAPAADKSRTVILHSNAQGQLTVRDADGRVLGRYQPEIYLASFSMTSWGDDSTRNKLIASDKDFIYVFTIDGKTVVRLPSPGSAPSSAAVAGNGTQVRFSSKASYFVGLLHYPLWDRSLLYIYEGEGQLVYDEILDDNCGALGSITNKNGAEQLLVGCRDKVLKYSKIEKEQPVR